MGQAQSDENSIPTTTTTNTPPPSANSPRDSEDTSSPSMDSLLAGSFFFFLLVFSVSRLRELHYSLHRKVLGNWDCFVLLMIIDKK